MFIIVALIAHGIAAQDDVQIHLFDHMRTPLDQETFSIVVDQFLQCDKFYVEINIDTQGAYNITKDVSLNLTEVC